MTRYFTLGTLAALFAFTPLTAAELSGKYIEARTCDVWTGPCFANADHNLTGKNAVIGWRIDQGSFDDVRLDGLGVVGVVAAANTLGLEQVAPSKVVLIVDSKADPAQREALVNFARRQGGELFRHVVAVQTADVSLDLCECENETCAVLRAGPAKVETRCLHTDSDKVCGNESAFYPPLTRNVTASAAAVVEHGYTGAGLGHTWRDCERRGAYVGSFSVR